MKSIPGPGADEEEVDPKAKAKDKGKKGGGEDVPETPIETAAAACLALASKWDKETFIANRALYGGDERLCVVLENAVWVEAERLRASVALVKELINAQVVWLCKMEVEGVAIAQTLIDNAYARELATIERLTAVVMAVIEDCSPIVTDWLLAADALAVRQNVLLAPRPESVLAPVLEEYDEFALSTAQEVVALRALGSLSLGGTTTAVPAASSSSSSSDGGSGVILMQDALAWADKTRCAAGPLSSCSVTYGAEAGAEGDVTGSLEYLQFPVGWRPASSGREILGALMNSKSAVGIADAAGVTSPAEVLACLHKFADKAVTGAGSGWTGSL
jgi:hypothetical protein